MEYSRLPFGYIDPDAVGGDSYDSRTSNDDKPKKKSAVFDQTGRSWRKRSTLLRLEAEREVYLKMATEKAILKRSYKSKELLLILLKQGLSTAEVVKHTGYTRNGVQKARTRFKEQGIID